MKIGDLIPLSEMRRLIDQGFQPVLAHPERYLYLSEEEYQAYKDSGIQFQRNLGTLEGMYGDAVCIRAEALEAEGMYEWVGTDLHKKKYSDFFDEHIFCKQISPKLIPSADLTIH